VGLTGVFAHLLGRVLIGAPLARMAQAIGRVRAGFLDTPLGLRRKDEIGALSAEFDAMLVELRRAREQIEEAEVSRRELQRGLQQADKLITVGQLSAGLAHEIGSPLQVLSGRARTLVTTATDAESRRHAEIIAAQCDRISRIVEQLLHYARRRPARRIPVDLRAATSSVLDLLALEARRRGVTLHLEAPEALPEVEGDHDALQQVILNLVNNAMGATPAGGSVVVCLGRGALPGVEGGGDRPALSLAVVDQGGGMPPEILERLFEPFFTTRAAQGGTGLGLAVARGIVNEHAGRITVSSEVGAGTEVLVLLPLRAGSSEGAGT
jgi:signal transduction histidine kinase